MLKIRRASEVALNAVMEGNDMPGRGSHAGEVQETNDLRHVAVFDEPQEGGLHGFEVVEASSGAERNDTSEAPVGGSGGGADGGGDEEKLEDEMVHASGSNEGNRPGGVPLAINEVDSASKNGRETTGTAEAGAEEEIRSPGEEGKGSTKGGKGMQHEDGEKTDEVRDKGSQAADHIMAVVEREEAEAVEVHQQPKESAAEERRMEDERTKKGEKDGSGNGSGEELSEAMDEEDDIEEMEARRANHKARTGSRPKGHPFPSVITRGRLRDLIEAQQRGGLVAADPSARKRHRGGGSIGGDAPHKIRLVSSGGGSGEKKRIGAKQQQPAQHRPRSTQPGEPDPDEEDAGAATKRPVYLYQVGDADSSRRRIPCSERRRKRPVGNRHQPRSLSVPLLFSG